MAKSAKPPVFYAQDDDPEMAAAMARARETFGHFWREAAWERRRIIPALGLAAVKAPFADKRGKNVEQMWMGEIDFDGETVTGVLLNTPNHLKGYKAGDEAQYELGDISDWMYTRSDEVYGAFTVHVLRARMSPAERTQHDGAWGLDFGSPQTPRVVPDFGEHAGDGTDHPMGFAMADQLREHLAGNPEFATEADDAGWTMLHHQALAGSAATVRVLLDHGADPAARTPDGRTPADLAKALGWEHVAALLG